VQVTVTALNDFYGAQPVWNFAGPVTVTPAGAPIWSSAPAVTAKNDANGTVTVSWAGLVNANGSAITSYSVSCASGTFGADVTSVNCTLPLGQSSTVTVDAINGVGRTTSPGAPATPPAPPATPTTVRVSVASPTSSSSGQFVPTFDGVSPTPQSNGGIITYQVSLDGGASSTAVAVGGSIQVAGNQYGVAFNVSVQVRVTYPNGAVLSSGWSDPVSPGMAVDARLTSENYSPDTGTVSWGGAPAAPPYEIVTITCNGIPTTDTSCMLTGPDAGVKVNVTANGGRQYEMDYNPTS